MQAKSKFVTAALYERKLSGRTLKLNVAELKMIILLILVALSTAEEINHDSTDEFCLSETFQPRCLKNEVILMRNATYGRMRIGRCITAEEVHGLGSHHLGCSANVFTLLDRKCLGKTECDIRVVEISDHHVKPCFPGLNVYLEASYDCINTADEGRSCAVDVSTTPVHIISSRTCGTKAQPWIVEAPVGQKINISFLALPASESGQEEWKSKMTCSNYGTIVDKTGKRNITICVAAAQREKAIYQSKGNAVDIYLNNSGHVDAIEARKFIIKLHAVGCSDIIPSEDAYLKRNNDEIVVGCYMSRKQWHLRCEDGKWIGVVGNCSQGNSIEPDLDSKAEPKSASFSNEAVLGMLALGGFTLAICLAIICFGVVCLRRFHSRAKMKQEYKTLNYQINSTGVHPRDRAMHPNMATTFHGNDVRGSVAQPMPTYSVFVGDEGEPFDDVRDSLTVNNTNTDVSMQGK